METNELENIETFLNNKPDGFLIVGIGASAGGLQALKTFFEHVPATSGMAYVVILHLSPDYDSQLAQVLQQVAAIPVLQVNEKVIIEPNHVYVVPPNRHLVLLNGSILPLANLNEEDRRAPVDIFFRHLANTYGPRVVVAILSGTGANGSMGLKRVKELGGVAFVQNPREAEYNEMPRNSIATEHVDEVLPVAEMPGAIMDYRDSIGMVEIAIDAEKRPEQEQQALREIFTELLIRSGHDFTNYKRPTLLRRIERRISIHNLPDLPSYSSVLHKNPDETGALLKDLLISVTNFFRDKKAFATIEQDVVPAILKGKRRGEQVRIWVAGCATGEEAYSLAILLAEKTLNVVDAPEVQIFATDIDEAAIAIARQGYYTLNDAADVSADRLGRYFTKDGTGYRVRREIREMILFAAHNFLKDPPFSRLDMISCRNVLIYLNNVAQERVMETFHFALKPGGYLFLGTSESVDGASDLFATYSRENHIFRARESTSRHFPMPEPMPKYLLQAPSQAQLREVESRPIARASFADLHQKLLEEYAPPSVVISEEYDIMHMSETVGSYLEFTGGEPTQNLLKLVKPELRLELRTALYQAIQKQTAVESRGLRVTVDNELQAINLSIRPVFNPASTSRGFILVLFQRNEDQQRQLPVMVSTDEPVTKQLEDELNRLKIQLRNSNEEHEYRAEELKAANEELQAMNEELRSSAEELVTSKEELQSTNEELRTVNQELKVKVEEITHTSNNLQNLINSADVGTIFLDRSLRIRMFTPAVRDIFNLIPSDHGRPISDITNKLDYHSFFSDGETVLEKLSVIEREVRTTDNRYFMMRVLPYRTAEDRINGVVFTFFSISRRKQAEIALQQSEDRLRLLIESASDYAILTQDTQRIVTSWSSGATRLLGYLEHEVLGQSGDIMFVSEDRADKVPESEAETARTEGRAENERWHIRKDGSRFWASGVTSPLRDHEGKLLGFVKILRDLTERKKAEEALLVSEERFRLLVTAISDSVYKMSPDWKLMYNLEGKNFLAETNDGSHTWMEQYIPAHEQVRVAAAIEKAIANKGVFELEHQVYNAAGSIGWVYSRAVPKINAQGEIVEWIVAGSNITERREAEEAVRSTAERLKLALDAGKLGTYEYDFETGQYLCTAQHKSNFGFSNDDEVTLDSLKERIVPGDRHYMETSFEKALDKDAVYSTEYRTQLPGGGVRWIRSVGRFVYGTHGKPLKMVGITLDITEEKFTVELSKQLKDRTGELQHSNNDLQQFAHVASHDLKEPVRKIQTFNNRVLDEYAELLPDKARTYLEKIGTATDRMMAMIDGVLRYSKLGATIAAFEQVDLNDVLQSIETDLEVLIQEKQAIIVKNNLPTLAASQILMYQLFYNLILNSLKFAKSELAAKIKMHCELIIVGDKQVAKITVSDNGLGFEPEYAEAIFETFTRLHPADEFEGTGLGLALCKKIVDRHGGTISATGAPNQGAIFTIMLPV